MQNNYINKLLDLKDVKLKNIEVSDNSLKITITTKPKEHICPTCGMATSKVHDYRDQVIKDLPFHFKDTYLILKKRRYVCSCGKRFYEKYYFLPRYHRMTTRLVSHVIKELGNATTYKDTARRFNLSTHTVARIFDHINYSQQSFSDVLCIDEFRGNANGVKFQAILVDGKKKNIVDILPTRFDRDLTTYFAQIPKKDRYRVKFFVSDMYRNYANLAKVFFPNAKIIVDKYHFVRQVTWALENVRKKVQNSMSADLRKYYKRSRKLLNARYKSLPDKDKEAVDLMLMYNYDLRRAHYLKESFYSILHDKSYKNQREDFYKWIDIANSYGLPEFKKCARTFSNWSKEILNALKYDYNNGVTEGYNNKIKVLKRVSYGVRNFDRFRNRILHINNFKYS